MRYDVVTRLKDVRCWVVVRMERPDPSGVRWYEPLGLGAGQEPGDVGAVAGPFRTEAEAASEAGALNVALEVTES